MTIWSNHYNRNAVRPPAGPEATDFSPEPMDDPLSPQRAAEDHLLKAQLVGRIDALLKERGLKQIEAARLFGVRQPDVSKMLHGDFRQFSVERLLRFLVALGRDVEINIRPHAGAGKQRRCASPETA
ncbi:helix-turn-helix transcriptional regulator [Methylocystis sp. IM4]|uniref:helix-turn-helix domain-containing protein n=1 Tax=Methylocystis sp. IM4 TaxID=3136560 RepID=UPI0031192A6A